MSSSQTPSLTAPSTGRLVARNTAAQVVTFAARALAGLTAVVLIARHGGPHPLGVFQFGLTLSQMFSFAVGLGLANLITREVARDQDGHRGRDHQRQGQPTDQAPVGQGPPHPSRGQTTAGHADQHQGDTRPKPDRGQGHKHGRAGGHQGQAGKPPLGQGRPPQHLLLNRHHR